jgi:hypothetical protein
LRKARTEKIPEQSEDDFFRPASPQGRLAVKDPAIQYLCRLKAEKQRCFQTQKMQTLSGLHSRSFSELYSPEGA